MNSQKFSKKDFSLSQYYSQLEKYESVSTADKRPSLKKDFSLNNFSKDSSKAPILSRTYKQVFNQERPKLGISEKYGSKTGFDKFDRSRVQNIKKHASPGDHYKVNSYLAESLNTSNITSKKGTNDSRLEEKQNFQEIPFGGKDEQKFLSHCSQLYNIKGQESLVTEIARQINKRDEVYEVVSQNFGAQSSQKLPQKLANYFEEHKLMAQIIEEFKSISKLQVDDLNELYYFLKSDR